MMKVAWNSFVHREVKDARLVSPVHVPALVIDVVGSSVCFCICYFQEKMEPSNV